MTACKSYLPQFPHPKTAILSVPTLEGPGSLWISLQLSASGPCWLVACAHGCQVTSLGVGWRQTGQAVIPSLSPLRDLQGCPAEGDGGDHLLTMGSLMQDQEALPAVTVTCDMFE